jgi:hypothetical protein
MERRRRTVSDADLNGWTFGDERGRAVTRAMLERA